MKGPTRERGDGSGSSGETSTGPKSEVLSLKVSGLRTGSREKTCDLTKYPESRDAERGGVVSGPSPFFVVKQKTQSDVVSR